MKFTKKFNTLVVTSIVLVVALFNLMAMVPSNSGMYERDIVYASDSEGGNRNLYKVKVLDSLASTTTLIGTRTGEEQEVNMDCLSFIKNNGTPVETPVVEDDGRIRSNVWETRASKTTFIGTRAGNGNVNTDIFKYIK